MLSRNQAHGSPANLLDFYAIADIPETEVYLDKCNPLLAKFASSAAHLAGHQRASSETGTWLTEHWQTTLADLKHEVDGLFIGGINHIFYHGTLLFARRCRLARLAILCVQRGQSPERLLARRAGVEPIHRPLSVDPRRRPARQRRPALLADPRLLAGRRAWDCHLTMDNTMNGSRSQPIGAIAEELTGVGYLRLRFGCDADRCERSREDGEVAGGTYRLSSCRSRSTCRCRRSRSCWTWPRPARRWCSRGTGPGMCPGWPTSSAAGILNKLVSSGRETHVDRPGFANTNNGNRRRQGLYLDFTRYWLSWCSAWSGPTVPPHRA